MRYFECMQNVLYSIDAKNRVAITVKDIMSRSQVIQSVMTNAQLFYPYRVSDGETPEIIADKYYNDPNRHWLVMFSNYIIDPYYDFPMSTHQFETYIVREYGSIETAQNTLHHVDEIESITNTRDRGQPEQRHSVSRAGVYEFDSRSGILKRRPLPTVSSGIWERQLAATQSIDGSDVEIRQFLVPISVYQFELTENELKREISLIDRRYADRIENELRTLMA